MRHDAAVAAERKANNPLVPNGDQRRLRQALRQRAKQRAARGAKHVLVKGDELRPIAFLQRAYQNPIASAGSELAARSGPSAQVPRIAEAEPQIDGAAGRGCIKNGNKTATKNVLDAVAQEPARQSLASLRRRDQYHADPGKPRRVGQACRGRDGSAVARKADRAAELQKQTPVGDRLIPSCLRRERGCRFQISLGERTHRQAGRQSVVRSSHRGCHNGSLCRDSACRG